MIKIQDYCDTLNGSLQLRRPLAVFHHGDIVTDDSDMKRQLDILVRCGQGRVPLTIRGENGTGKDQIAQYAHAVSAWHKVPLIKMNCAFLTEEQQSVKLFGPASNRELGLLNRAAGGSLYIENVPLMSGHLQWQLMNYIRETSLTEKAIRFMICLNKRDLQEAALTEELSYYFSAVVFDIPPLRKRPQDILLLTFQQLQFIRSEYRLERCISPEVMHEILAYDWPGNSHQLAHTIERMAILSDDTLMDSVQLLHRCMTPDHQLQQQPAKAPAIPESRSLKRMVQDYEYMVIQQAVEQHGSIRKAAAVLKTSHATLSRKITEYNLLPKP